MVNRSPFVIHFGQFMLDSQQMSEPNPIESESDMLILNEVQLVLSEKRTALSSMRTGIAIFAFPLSVLSVLIATSKSYTLGAVLHWLIPLLLLNLGLVILAIYLISMAVRRIHHYDRLIDDLKRKHSKLSEFID